MGLMDDCVDGRCAEMPPLSDSDENRCAAEMPPQDDSGENRCAAADIRASKQGESSAGSTMLVHLSYDGAPYAGFARQPGIATVQGDLEQALAVIYRREVVTECAGRTDTGVHALDQAISFHVDADELAAHPCAKLVRSMNALTDDAIAITACERRAPGFSARFDALSREYRYRLICGDRPPLFLRDYAWWCASIRNLDIPSMELAASALVGEHDFKSFCKAISAVDRPTSRFVETLDMFTETQMGEECLVIRVVGNAFLHSMVRTIVGTLVEVGAHRREPGWVAEVLAACDRRAAGPTAPACGLTLWHVAYPPAG